MIRHALSALRSESAPRLPLVTLLIIAANFAVTAWTWSLPEAKQSQIALEYGFVPARLSNVGKGQAIAGQVHIDRRAKRPAVRTWSWPDLSTDPAEVYPTFLTTMFLHGGWVHLLMNMWMLWIFGNNIEDRLGHFMYLVFYLLGGVVATLAFWASDPEGFMPVIGASGAVAAVLGGYAVTFPTAKVRTFVFFIFITIIDLPALVVLGHLVCVASDDRPDGIVGRGDGAGGVLVAHRRLRGRHDPDAAVVARRFAARQGLAERNRRHVSFRGSAVSKSVK